MTVEIDQSLCTRCGTCIKGCACGCLELGEDGNVRVNARPCMKCGQCYARCPRGAIRFCGHGADEAPVPKTDAERIAAGRRSVRHFSPEPLSAQEVEAFLDVVRYCPSAMNVRKTQFWVLGRAALDRIAPKAARALGMEAAQQKRDVLFRGAPQVVIGLVEADASYSKRQDATIALASAEFARPAGVGTFWCGFLTGAARADPSILADLGIPAGLVIASSMGIGHQAEHFCRPVPREQVPVIFVE